MSRRENNRTYNGDNHDQYNQYRADHGENFVPGSEDAPNLAPQPLDHFKRGYQERTNQRERDLRNFDGGVGGINGNKSNNNDMDNGGGGGGGPHHENSRYINKSEGGKDEGSMPPLFRGGGNGSFIGGGRGNGGSSRHGGGGNRG
eukprot:CAMPEP_0201199178 /NCGR_PEP_ID=MMETSP0851-20130426/158358_1 /ASSEMBLY_ACC=CAM_ASM_000631 /TAXON_ID=183588 /ORGANISM="Pseudo-nitzschia fraudulenta, Strain WWA7" /LENGTH=144 /DNA_ID=CAMNT_0047486543 /DNA_START=133 /DNA_END=563 /DNA_ORIENTATION=-